MWKPLPYDPVFRRPRTPSGRHKNILFTTKTGLEADLTIKGDITEISKLQGSGGGVGAHYRTLQDNYRNRYLYQQGVLDDVILNIMTKASTRPCDRTRGLGKSAHIPSGGA